MATEQAILAPPGPAWAGQGRLYDLRDIPPAAPLQARLPPLPAHRRGGCLRRRRHCHHRYKERNRKCSGGSEEGHRGQGRDLQGVDRPCWPRPPSCWRRPAWARPPWPWPSRALLGAGHQAHPVHPGHHASDIIGFSMPGKDGMVYQPGAIMTNLLLADEIYRPSRKPSPALHPRPWRRAR